MISLLRSVAAVLAGYIVFAASSYAAFRVTGQDPHAEASVSCMVITITAGIVFALAGSYIAGWIAGRKPLAHGMAMAALLALGAGVSLAATLGHGAIWTQVAALTLMAPSAVAGGWLAARMQHANIDPVVSDGDATDGGRSR